MYVPSRFELSNTHFSPAAHFHQDVKLRFMAKGWKNRKRTSDRSELTQNFNLHWFLRRVIVLIAGRACVLALVALALDVLDGQSAVWNTLSHICGQFDVILQIRRENKIKSVQLMTHRGYIGMLHRKLTFLPNDSVDGIAGHWTFNLQSFAGHRRDRWHWSNVRHACENRIMKTPDMSIKFYHRCWGGRSGCCDPPSTGPCTRTRRRPPSSRHWY